MHLSEQPAYLRMPNLYSCSYAGSALQATLHDAAHHAFMTLPAYSRTRAGEARHLGRGPNPAGWAFE